MKSIKGKVQLLVVFIQIIPLILVTSYSLIIFSNNQMDNNSEIMNLQVSNIQNYYTDYFNEIEKVVELLQMNDNVKGQLNSENDERIWMQKFFKNINETYPDTLFVYMGLEDGSMYMIPNQSLPDDFDPRNRIWYTEQKKTNDVIFSKPYIDQSTGGLIITQSKYIRNNGVIGIDMSINELSNMLNQDYGYDTLQIIFTDDKGNIMLHSDSDMINKNISNTEMFKLNNYGSQETKYNGVSVYQNYSYLDVLGWRMYILVNVDEQNGEIVSHLILMFSISQQIIVFQILQGIIFPNRFLVKPIKKLTNNIKELEKGNFNIQTDNIPNDEIGESFEQLKTLQDKVKDIIFNIKDSIEIVLNSSNDMENISKSSKEFSNNLNDQINNIETEIENTSSVMEEQTSGVEEISQTSQNMSKLTQDLNDSVQKLTNNSNEGKGNIDNIVNDLKTQEINSNKTSKIVKQVEEKSQDIGKIVEQINKISEQTNLLALNAQIEQQRAEEQGKGFSVVADEIRKLAEESTSTTKEIDNILKEIKTGINNSNKQTQETDNIINNVTNFSNEVETQFQNIIKEIEDINSMIENLTVISEEQSQSTEEITSTIDSSTKSVISISSNVENVSSQSKDQLNDINKIYEEQEKLNNESEELLEKVKFFKFKD